MASTIPKTAGTRQRRNRVVGARTLTVVDDLEVPDLPPRKVKTKSGRRTVQWQDATLEWWALIWASPMAPEYDESDLPELIVLAVLMDEFHRGDVGLAGEIRLQRQCFGLTPIDRRRLQWEIDRGEAADAKTATRRAAQRPKPAPTTGEDPRAALA